MPELRITEVRITERNANDVKRDIIVSLDESVIQSILSCCSIYGLMVLLTQVITDFDEITWVACKVTGISEKQLDGVKGTTSSWSEPDFQQGMESVSCRVWMNTVTGNWVAHLCSNGNVTLSRGVLFLFRYWSMLIVVDLFKLTNIETLSMVHSVESTWQYSEWPQISNMAFCSSKVPGIPNDNNLEI